MKEKYRAKLPAIFNFFEKILHFSKDIRVADALHRDEKTFDTVWMNFIVMG